MGVALVAAAHLAHVRLVLGVDMRVLLAVRAVGESPLASRVLALEGLLTCVGRWEKVSQSVSQAVRQSDTQAVRQSDTQTLSRRSSYNLGFELEP